ncbi:MAG TPA: ABC transporter ATP-binding protein [Polyangia bacterium]|jgi:lipopolysaccharide transport system ATP-binding protein
MLPIVRATALAKQYRLGAAPGGYRSLREVITGVVTAPFAALRRKAPPSFWALEDVSFDIAAGEAVGIIGRNGAGKSTLLKILSRITAPTRGEVRLRGRVSSLLEVGTGFHGELSGRENIFLNGSIMGMTRAEVRARFDEIVAFAEVGEHLDTPVKRYSSGMYVRLAFAVAAHLQPEILVVDEVLAVGDLSFQRKCLGKMQDVASSGRTVIFVSHNMAAISRLCSRAILLHKGRIVADGAVATVVGTYVSGGAGSNPSEVDLEAQGIAPGDDDVRLLAARVVSDGMSDSAVDIRRAVAIEIDYEVRRERYALHPNIHLFNEEGACVFVTGDMAVAENRRPRPPGRYRAVVTIPPNFLAEGMLSIDVAISTLDPVIVHVVERGLVCFHIHDPGEGDSARGNYAGPFPGVVRPLLPWQTRPLPAREAVSS